MKNYLDDVTKDDIRRAKRAFPDMTRWTDEECRKEIRAMRLDRMTVNAVIEAAVNQRG